LKRVTHDEQSKALFTPLILTIMLTMIPAVMAQLPIDAEIEKVHIDGSIKFTIIIQPDDADHYGVGIAFADSLTNPKFQVWYREYEAPFGFFFQEWTGTGWNGWGGDVIPLSEKPGFSGEGSFDSNTFVIIVPESAVAECGETYYYAIQYRTNLIGTFPEGWGWDSPVEEYASQDMPPCPPPEETPLGQDQEETPVGGYFIPTNKIGVLTPYLIAAVLLGLTITLAVKKRRN